MKAETACGSLRISEEKRRRKEKEMRAEAGDAVTIWGRRETPRRFRFMFYRHNCNARADPRRVQERGFFILQN
jgi:hypothetical protein